MQKINNLIEKLCPNGVEYKTIGELFDVKNGYTPSKNNKYFWENGNIPWFRMDDIRTNGNILNDATQHITELAIKNRKFPKDSLIVATTATIGVHALIKCDFVCNQQLTCVAIKEKFKNDLNIKFCFYYFDIIDEQCKKIANQGGGMPIVSLEKMKKLVFPVPPMEVQCEIVRILDTFSNNIEILSNELALRKKQMQYIMQSLLNNNRFTEFKTLGEISNIEKGRTALQKSKLGEYPLVATTEYLQSSDTFQFNCEAVCLPLISARGHGVASITRIFYQKGKFALGNILCAIIPKNYNIKAEFLRHYLYFYKDIILVPLMKGGANVSLTIDSLKKVKVAIPSIEEQNNIINKINTISRILDNNIGLPVEIEARQKQYEYYRDKLLTFKELKVNE